MTILPACQESDVQLSLLFPADENRLTRTIFLYCTQAQHSRYYYLDPDSEVLCRLRAPCPVQTVPTNSTEDNVMPSDH